MAAVPAANPKPAVKASGPCEVRADQIAGLHPAVPEIVQNLVYRTNDLRTVTIAWLQLMLRSRRVGVTPANAAGVHYVVTGVRTWQVIAAAQARSLARLPLVPVEILGDADSNERVAELCAADLLIEADLFALHSRTWDGQRSEIEKLLPPERINELFAPSPKGPRTSGRWRKGKKSESQLP